MSYLDMSDCLCIALIGDFDVLEAFCVNFGIGFSNNII